MFLSLCLKFFFIIYSKNRYRINDILKALISLVFLLPGLSLADGQTPIALTGIKPLAAPGLLNGNRPIVVDKKAAIQLGKALFWDSNVGSDGMACASCHFHAGADRRIRNQLSPGLLHTNSITGKSFEPLPSGGIGGPNYVLKLSDFPLHQLSDPHNQNSTVLFTTDDVVSSSGTFKSNFRNVHLYGHLDERCNSEPDDIFHINDLNSRQVQPRNAPSVINAAYNFRNFWDGRANNIFNGVSAFGKRDVDATVWVREGSGAVVKKFLRLRNSSLASQAVSPPLNTSEMSCSGRQFPYLGRKLLGRRPLNNQRVHPNDSVLGDRVHPTGLGLNTTYRALIKKSFAPRFWKGKGDFGIPAKAGEPYSHMEANFSMFFGIALQLYQETLVSDQSPFDSPRTTVAGINIPNALTAQQVNGLKIFLDAHCMLCHKGPTLSSAAHPLIHLGKTFYGNRLITRKTLRGAFSGGTGVVFGLMDDGYFNTSVTPDDHDPGVGGTDPFGNPLSFTGQYLNMLQGKTDKLIDPILIKTCMFDTPFTLDYIASELVDEPNGTENCDFRSTYAKVPRPSVLTAELAKPYQGRALAALKGAFKTPTLRNIELTGPYMHNGSMATLEQVVDFYFRGGNYTNTHHFATLVFQQDITPEKKADLVAFLKSFTDERVRWEKAPFDHPQLVVPHGHTRAVDPEHIEQVQDSFIYVPSVGKYGRSLVQGPLKPFEAYLRP
jgi:cytochrome c peroxidase